jgi:acyl-CoA thioesterase-1
VVNASVSGETTSGGRSRMRRCSTQHQPSQVVIELGGNDALRGLPLKNTEDNLTFMVQAAQKAGAKVLLVGMQVPPNYGTDYANRFAACLKRWPRRTKRRWCRSSSKVWPMGRPHPLFQPDRIHPAPRPIRSCWPMCGRSSKIAALRQNKKPCKR